MRESAEAKKNSKGISSRSPSKKKLNALSKLSRPTTLQSRALLNSSSSSSLPPASSKKIEFINYGIEPQLIVESGYDELIPLQRMIKALVTELFKKKKQALSFEFPNARIVDLLVVVDEWWKKIDVSF